MPSNRWWPQLLRRRRDREIAEEIESHLAMATRDHFERGQPPEAARLAALREFGNVGLIRDATRGVWMSNAFEQLLQDLKFGVRILWRSPGLSATAVILVALVIGGNTTVYSTVHGLLTNPARGVTANRLVCVAQVSPDSARIGPFVSYPNYLDYRSRLATVQQIVAWTDERLTLTVDETTYAAFGSPVSAAFFETFGVQVAHGRSFHESDDRMSGGSLAAVISDRFWQRHLQRSPHVVGRTMIINGQPATIVGIAAPGFLGPNLTPGTDVWVPIEAFFRASGNLESLSSRRQSMVVMVGRLAPGVSVSQAQAEVGALSAQLAAAYPVENKDRRAVVFKYSVAAMLPVAEMAPRFLTVFSVITLLTLLIVSANVANLMLARAVVRQRETAVRQSLGASRWRILRMLVAEGLAISITAWLAACLLALWVSRVLVWALPPGRESLVPDVTPDWQVVAYAMVLAIGATLAFILAPILRTWRRGRG